MIRKICRGPGPCSCLGPVDKNNRAYTSLFQWLRNKINTFTFNKSATNAVIRTLLQPTFVGGARTLAQHQSARFIFLIGPNGVQSSRANSRRLLAVRAHYPITRIKLAVGPTANKSCIVYGGLKGTPFVHHLAYLSTWAATHFNSARLVQSPRRQR